MSQSEYRELLLEYKEIERNLLFPDASLLQRTLNFCYLLIADTHG
jgi:hypothetical protein